MSIRFTDRELDLMSVLWDRGSATVPEMMDALDDDFAYSTVSTVLRILEEKGHVGHTVEGRFHRYHPLVERASAGRSALRYLKDKLFEGSPEALLSHFVSDPELTEEDLSRIRKLIDERTEEGS